MKSFVSVIIWTLLFIGLGIYSSIEICDFTDRYTSKIEVVENHIENDDFDLAKDYLSEVSKSWHEEKSSWYKLLNHDQFDDISLYLTIIEKGIELEDKSMSFEYILKTKMRLDNIRESEVCDFNHII